MAGVPARSPDVAPTAFHPIAGIFPLMDDDKLQSLADDIREHGLREPIVRFDGKVLDGRNRLAACHMAGVDPQFRDFQGDVTQAVAFSWSENFNRRHLTASQAAIAESKRKKLDEEYAAEILEKEAAAKQRNVDGGKNAGRGRPQEKAQEIIPKPNGHVREERAKTAGTNPHYVSDADRIVNERPDLAEKIQHGQMTIPEAKREMEPPKPPPPFPVSDGFFDWLNDILMRTDGILMGIGSLGALLDNDKWDTKRNHTIYGMLFGLHRTIGKFLEEMESWQKNQPTSPGQNSTPNSTAKSSKSKNSSNGRKRKAN